MGKGAKTWVSDVALCRSRGRVALRRCLYSWSDSAVDAPTLDRRCDSVGAATREQRCDAGATLRRAATLRLCWRCDAGATLRRGSDAATRCDAATLLSFVGAATLRRFDAGSTLRRCWRCDAATRERRCDALGAATLPSARVHTVWLRGSTH